MSVGGKERGRRGIMDTLSKRRKEQTGDTKGRNQERGERGRHTDGRASIYIDIQTHTHRLNIKRND